MTNDIKLLSETQTDPEKIYRQKLKEIHRFRNESIGTLFCLFILSAIILITAINKPLSITSLIFLLFYFIGILLNQGKLKLKGLTLAKYMITSYNVFGLITMLFLIIALFFK